MSPDLTAGSTSGRGPASVTAGIAATGGRSISSRGCGSGSARRGSTLPRPDHCGSYTEGWYDGTDLAEQVVRDSRDKIAAGVCVEEKSEFKEMVLRLLDTLADRIAALQTYEQRQAEAEGRKCQYFD